MVSTRNVDYEGDDDYSINRGGIRQPLLNQQGPQASASTSVDTKGNQDAWSTRLREKVFKSKRMSHKNNKDKRVTCFISVLCWFKPKLISLCHLLVITSLY